MPAVRSVDRTDEFPARNSNKLCSPQHRNSRRGNFRLVSGRDKIILIARHEATVEIIADRIACRNSRCSHLDSSGIVGILQDMVLLAYRFIAGNPFNPFTILTGSLRLDINNHETCRFRFYHCSGGRGVLPFLSLSQTSKPQLSEHSAFTIRFLRLSLDDISLRA